MALLIKLIKKEKGDLVSAISIVDEPAILTQFMKFAVENRSLKFAVDKDKMQITGPVLIPNVKIFRSGKSLGIDQDAYVYFEEESVRDFAEDFIGNVRNNENTLNHGEKTDKFMMLESWIIEDAEKYKATALGFDLPVGTWMATYKVLDNDLWAELKAGEYNGFSIEVNSTLVPIGEITLSDDRQILSEEIQKPVLKHLKKIGIKQEDFEKQGYSLIVEDDELNDDGEAVALLLAILSNPDEKSSLDRGKFAIRYKYFGPRDEKNRTFCADVLDADLIYRKEDIMQGTNPEFGTYNLFKWKGSYNCRHIWKRLTFIKTEGIPSSDIEDHREIPKGDLPDSYIPNDEDATSLNPKPV